MSSNHSHETIIILDFGSQYTQLIARRVRELNVYSEILPYNTNLENIKQKNVKGIIFSGGPASIYKKNAPKITEKIFTLNIPILGICYGLQIIMDIGGGENRSGDEKRIWTSLTYSNTTDSPF